MKTKILYIITILMLVTLVYFVSSSYALFESEKTIVVHPETAKWNIVINGKNINTIENFVIDSFNIEENENTLEGKIAPSLSGYFDIEIDPTNTDTSIMYEVIFDFNNLEPTIKVDKIEEINGYSLKQVNENTYSNKITLSEIKSGVKHNIRVYIEWVNDEEKNQVDSLIGTDINGSIEIPVIIDIKQYLGEEI